VGSREQNKKMDSSPPLLQTPLCLFTKFFLFLSFRIKKKKFREMDFCSEQNKMSSLVSSISPCCPLPVDAFMTGKEDSKTSSVGKKLTYPQVSLL